MNDYAQFWLLYLQGSFSSDFLNQDLHLNTLSKSPESIWSNYVNIYICKSTKVLNYNKKIWNKTNNR